MPPPLAGLRALDLTDALGYLCGRLLADLGALVIKVEPPGGDAGRTLAPRFRAPDGRERPALPTLRPLSERATRQRASPPA